VLHEATLVRVVVPPGGRRAVESEVVLLSVRLIFFQRIQQPQEGLGLWRAQDACHEALKLLLAAAWSTPLHLFFALSSSFLRRAAAISSIVLALSLANHGVSRDDGTPDCNMSSMLAIFSSLIVCLNLL
jgi:hypothetical protein